MSIECDQWANQLQTEDAKKEQDAHDFAGPALRQPTFEPGESHSREQQVHHRKCEEDDQAQGSKRGCAAPNADGDSEQPETGHGGGRIQRSVGKANQKI